jgi:hypothetical protein
MHDEGILEFFQALLADPREREIVRLILRNTDQEEIIQRLLELEEGSSK